MKKKNQQRKEKNSDTTNLFDAHKNASYRKYSNDKSTCNNCTSSCPKFTLCEKRIFIVGGVERMEALYRDFIEENGGFLDYHSGDMKQGSKKIENCMQRADVIICPINCNSHTACIKVKNLAKKCGKAFHMLPTGSLSAVKSLLQSI